MKKHIISLVSLMALLLAGCSNDSEGTVSYLRLSQDSFSFDVDDTASYTATVESAPAEWQMIVDSEWIIVEQQDNSIVISVTPNMALESRQGKITVTNQTGEKTITVSQLGLSDTNVSYRILHNTIFSRSGTMGLKTTEDGTTTIQNFATGEVTAVTRVPYMYSPALVSDDGSIVIANHESKDPMQLVNGEWEYMQVPSGYSMARVWQISTDASIAVGTASKTSEINGRPIMYPVKWVNGVGEILDAPTEDLYGQPLEIGSQAIGCSADGSVIYGSFWEYTIAIYWKPDGTWAYVSDELTKLERLEIGGDYYDDLSAPIMLAHTTCISPNGKYIGTHYRKYDADYAAENGGSYMFIPLIVNLETGEYTLLEDITNGTIQTVNNYGLSFGSNHVMAGAGTIDGFVYDSATDTSKTTAEWIQDTYGIILEGDYYVDQTYNNSSMISGMKIDILNMPFYIRTDGM